MPFRTHKAGWLKVGFYDTYPGTAGSNFYG